MDDSEYTPRLDELISLSQAAESVDYLQAIYDYWLAMANYGGKN
jgi:hypothetical protein